MSSVSSDIYDNIIQKIQDIYSSCSPMEQSELVKILEELSLTGDSYTLEKIWLADFKDIPVSIDRFISDPYYLGGTNRNGDAVYPFWKQTLNDIFSVDNEYTEIVLSGATRIGKTSTMVVILAYMLYRLMLYRDPHSYFQKKQVSKFTIGFANLTKELAEGVAYREFNDTLKASPFFCDNGTFSRSDRNFYYVPNGDNITIVPGSDSSRFLGQQLWACLTGQTKIVTPQGIKTLQECEGTYQDVYSVLDDGSIQVCNAPVVRTKEVTDLIRITPEDGSIIEGTPDHRVMLSNGEYKALGELSSSDDLLTEVDNIIKIKSIEHIQLEKPEPVYDVLDVKPNHNFVIQADSGSLLISHNCAIDECNFAKAGIKDINKAKAHMKSLYDTINARISGTFRLQGKVYGKMVTASSKNTESDFLSDHIDSQLSAGNKHMLVIDEPQWKILPPEMFSGETFKFTVGDRYKKGFVISPENDDEAHIQDYISQGYRIIEAPAELRQNFIADYDISLRDIAGISVVGTFGFITQEMLTPCIATDRRNPFYSDTIVIGKKDSYSIESFFHAEEIPSNLKSHRINIHLDLAETGDRCGIAGSCVDGSKIVTDMNDRKIARPFMKELFCVGVEAPRGDRIPFQKVVNFIVWLRRSGFNIGTVSTDQYQSSYLREVLEQQQFETDKISVDASIDPYVGLQNMLVDQCIELVHNDLQETELVRLQKIGLNKIDHPANGSKDVADAACGSVWTLVKEGVQDTPSGKSIAKMMSSVNSNIYRNGSKPTINNIFLDPRLR